jgi:hypothetical protein
VVAVSLGPGALSLDHLIEGRLAGRLPVDG